MRYVPENEASKTEKIAHKINRKKKAPNHFVILTF
jgi:hypothetical protein